MSGSGGQSATRPHDDDDAAPRPHRDPFETAAPSRWDDDANDFGGGDGAAAGAGRLRILATVALLVLAALQSALLLRSEIASAMPALRPVIGTVAGAFGMSVDPLRSLASLSIESSELRPAGHDDHLTFDAVLGNRDDHPVRWPAMELTLKDAVGAVLVRKVVMPADYLVQDAPREGLGPRSEQPVRIELDPDGLQAAGYSVTLYYP